MSNVVHVIFNPERLPVVEVKNPDYSKEIIDLTELTLQDTIEDCLFDMAEALWKEITTKGRWSELTIQLYAMRLQDVVEKKTGEQYGGFDEPA